MITSANGTSVSDPAVVPSIIQDPNTAVADIGGRDFRGREFNVRAEFVVVTVTAAPVVGSAGPRSKGGKTYGSAPQKTKQLKSITRTSR